MNFDNRSSFTPELSPPDSPPRSQSRETSLLSRRFERLEPPIPGKLVRAVLWEAPSVLAPLLNPMIRSHTARIRSCHRDCSPSLQTLREIDKRALEVGARVRAPSESEAMGSTIETLDTRSKSAISYRGWAVVLGAFFGVMTGYAVLLPYTFGFFIKPLQASFGWRRDQISVAFSWPALIGWFHGERSTYLPD